MMRPLSSLGWRVGWRIAVAFIACFALSVLVFAMYTGPVIDTIRDNMLRDLATDIAADLETDGQAAVLDLPRRIREAYADGGNAYLYVIYAPDGPLVFFSSPAAADMVGDRVRDGPEGIFQFDLGERTIRGYRLEKDGFTIVVTESGSELLIDSFSEQFLMIAITWLVPVLAIAIVISLATIRNGLAPLKRISAEAARIEPGTLSLRLSETDLPRDVQPLVTAFNRALNRLEEGFAAQRRLTAEAAHQLRTPLAVLTARLESLEDRQGLDALSRDVQRMNRLVEQLLAMARLELSPDSLDGDVDLRAIAVDVISELAPLAIAQDRTLALAGTSDPVVIRGNDPAIRTALTNLIENALVHTPPGSQVGVRVCEDGTVEVSDEGPGIAEAERAEIFERFHRGAKVRASGAGLGLAIVKECAELHGGSVTVADRAGGGAVFTLRLAPGPDRRRAM